MPKLTLTYNYYEVVKITVDNEVLYDNVPVPRPYWLVYNKKGLKGKFTSFFEAKAAAKYFFGLKLHTICKVFPSDGSYENPNPLKITEKTFQISPKIDLDQIKEVFTKQGYHFYDMTDVGQGKTVETDAEDEWAQLEGAIKELVCSDVVFDINVERQKFEKIYPVPENCVWIGTGYAATSYNAWKAHEHCTLWQGWITRAKQ